MVAVKYAGPLGRTRAPTPPLKLRLQKLSRNPFTFSRFPRVSFSTTSNNLILSEWSACFVFLREPR